MNRKFNNSLSALTITGAMLVTTVVFGLSPLDVERSTQPAIASVDGNASATHRRESSAPPVSRATGGSVPFRHALLMPYFSFVPRG
ncbi:MULTISPECIES: hypothetical protein [Lysobacteraceae]|uniref:Uncharacterized protein n=1 Tax=Novilysobacter avium TaxID=2781023 RepID=A0A7S6ZTM8_9GAMM|nr:MULTISPECIES: hypothetical protein [Lysobacter]QOW21122.1 hypothetical protein INQ42_07400 [Lysobacter avium]QOW23615.1 hypothetical protein INQ43_07455 [Lysobacter sp. H23M47]